MPCESFSQPLVALTLLLDSDHYQTEEEKLFIAEYGSPYDIDTPLDPLQRERWEMLEKQAYAIREKYGIRFEDVFTQNGMDSKYEPEAIEDY